MPKKGEVERPLVWTPNSTPQYRFCSSTAREVLFGGSVGGGKTAGMQIISLMDYERPEHSAIFFRRKFPELQNVIHKSQRLINAIAPKPYSKYVVADHTWFFKSGSKVRFGHMEYEKDRINYIGDEYNTICFDELTTFSELQYTHLITRARSAAGLPIRIRSGTNPPETEEGEWVFRRWGPWLDPEYEHPLLPPRFAPDGRRLPPAEDCQILWYLPGANDENEESAKVETRWVPEGTPNALSRQFIRARLTDNVDLMRNDPLYIESLKDLDPVRRARLLDGDWVIKPAAGQFFKRGMVKIVDAPPSQILWTVRYWDRAYTKPSKAYPNPDWTRGVMMSLCAGGLWFVQHVAGIREETGPTADFIERTAKSDAEDVDEIGIERDPAGAGKFEASSYVERLKAFNVRVYDTTRVMGNKIKRFQPFSGQCAAGRVYVQRDSPGDRWNEKYFSELEGFPQKGHKDDQVDATSGCHFALTSGVGGKASFKGMPRIKLPYTWQ